MIATMKYVDDFTDFSSDPEMQSGHFFPFSLGSGYSGKTIKVQRVAPTLGTETASEDTDWVLKVEKGKRFTVKADDKLVMTLNFRNSTMIEPPVGEKAISVPEDHDYGQACGNAKDMCRDVSIAWNGTNGAVTGTFYKGNKGKTYQLPIKIDNYYSGKSITVHVTTDTSSQTLDWHNDLGNTQVKAKAAKLTVKCGKLLLAELTFDGAVFNNGSAPE